MGKIQSSLNHALAMTVVDTMKYLAVKVPRSEGAKAVFVVESEMDCSFPDNVATDTEGLVSCVLMLGNHTPADCGLNNNGALTTRDCRKIITDTTLGESIVYHQDGPSHKRGMYPVPINEDGEYYITLGVTSLGCVAVRGVSVRLDFVIIK